MSTDAFPAPSEGILHFVVVSDIARSREFYTGVLGGEAVMDGDQELPDDPDRTSAFLNIRVADIQSVYQDWSRKGARFITPRQDRGGEIRCYVHDPDGHLIEVGQSTGILEQVRA